jgi:hypothetical protein
MVAANTNVINNFPKRNNTLGLSNFGDSKSRLKRSQQRRP